MTMIYVLFPGSFPQFPEIESRLSSQYQFQPLEQIDALTSSAGEKGIVLLGGELDKVTTWVGMVRTIAPQLCPLVVLNREQLDQVPESLQVLTDFIPWPCHPTELRARCNAAMQVSELRRLLEESAQLDEITELYNHQFFVKRLGEEMSLAKRHLSPVACVVIGIAYYEVFLDSYGYQFITEMLRQMARVIQSHVRKEDLIARLGDSEIAMLLPRSTEKGALALTRRVIEKLESVPLQAGDQTEHLYLSAGITSYPLADESDVDPDTLIRYARHALHSARCSDDTKVQLFTEMRPHVS